MHLGLSEISIKRLFYRGNCNLQQLVDMEILALEQRTRGFDDLYDSFVVVPFAECNGNTVEAALRRRLYCLFRQFHRKQEERC